MVDVIVKPTVHKVIVQPQETTVRVTSPGPQGIPGMQGPPGNPGAPGGSRFTHVQAVAASVWSITHNLGYTPHTTVRIAGEDVSAGSDIFHIDLNNMTISFSTPLAGTVDLS